jgi:hypothetical protein
MILPALISHDSVNFLGSSPASEHGVHSARSSIFVGAVILTSPPSLSREIQGELVHGDSSGRLEPDDTAWRKENKYSLHLSSLWHTEYSTLKIKI